jgi:hypothetical protein
VEGKANSLLNMVFVQPVCGLEMFTKDNDATGSKRRGMDLQAIGPSGFVFSSEAG